MVKYGTVQNEREAFFKYQRGDLPLDEAEVRLAMGDFYLDAPLSETSSVTHLDMLKCRAPNPDDDASLNEEHMILWATIADMSDSLNRHERMLIRYRLLNPNPWTFDKLAKELGISRQRIQQIEVRLKRKLKERLVLDDTLFSSSSLTHLDMLKCDSPDPDECAALSEKQIIVQAVIADMADSMDEHERMLIRHRLLTHTPWTFDKLAKEWGVCRQRVQQKEARLKRKLKERLIAKGISMS
jgi:RNA polymerase sigma factor (sigma-70 family)